MLMSHRLRALNECIMRIAQHVLHIQYIAHVLEDVTSCTQGRLTHLGLCATHELRCGPIFDKRPIIKGEGLGHSGENHFYRDYQGLGEIGSFSAPSEEEGIQFQEHREAAGLPKGEEKDGFYAEELRKGAKWLQAFLGRHVEKHQAVEREADRHVVDA